MVMNWGWMFKINSN